MPYTVLVCKDCDMMLDDGSPHGAEDEYCEAESGLARINVFTQHEMDRRVRDAVRATLRHPRGLAAAGDILDANEMANDAVGHEDRFVDVVIEKLRGSHA